MKLTSVYQKKTNILALYDLLKEREPHQSISHKTMPTIEGHAEFYYSQPYKAWYMVEDSDTIVGSVYLTNQREVGVFIFKAHQGKGYGKQAIQEIMKRWPGKFLFNVNPMNEVSQSLFEGMGAKLIQYTYEL